MAKIFSRSTYEPTSGNILLVRHPAPHPTESLYGYLLRLSEVNGYPNITPMMNLAGFKEKKSRKLKLDLTKIARVTNRSLEDLERISHNDPDKSYARLAGHKVLSAHLRWRHPAMCPECVQEKGYAEAHWELHAMTGCPIHKRALLSSCNSCGKRLTWFRQGLLICSCGEALTGSGLAPITPEEVELLNVIRCSVLRLPAETDNPSKLPVSDLSRMDLYPLLTLIRALGDTYHFIRPPNDEGNSCSQTAGAAQALSDWPNGLINLLAAMRGLKASKGLRHGDLRKVYFAVFKSRAIPDRTQVSFIKRVCLDFAETHWGKREVASRIRRHDGVDHPEHYITPMGLAKRLNIHPNTLGILIEAGAVPHLKGELHGSRRNLIDSRKVSLNPRLPGKVMSSKRAAVEIGVSVALVKALRESGTYEIRSTPKSFRVFHEADVRYFIMRFRSSACLPATDEEPGERMTVRKALHELRHSLETQLQFIQSVLARQISLIGDSNTALPDFEVSGAAFRSFRESRMPLWYRETLTNRVAGRRLGCCYQFIMSLVEDGHLEKKRTPIGARITKKSVEEFGNAFVRLAAIAFANNTSARALTGICEVEGIFHFAVKPRGCSTEFVRREDAELIAKLWQDYRLRNPKRVQLEARKE